MINDESKNRYCFAVKNLLELNSLGWLRGTKEAIINGVNFFQNALNEALNYQTIETHPEITSKIKPYIDKYNWKGIESPAGSKDWKKFEQNNYYILRVEYRSEYNQKRKKQVILLIITDGIKWHYLAVRNLSALLAKMSSNHKGDFYCLNCFNSYTAKNKLKEHEEICNNNGSCHIHMPKWFEKY